MPSNKMLTNTDDGVVKAKDRCVDAGMVAVVGSGAGRTSAGAK